MSIKSISITLSVENTARADVMLTDSRAYYRFATIDTCEEGEIPCKNIPDVLDKINLALNTHATEPMPQDVKYIVTIAIDNNNQFKYDNNNISLLAYRSLINILSQINDEFIFIRGFK